MLFSDIVFALQILRMDYFTYESMFSISANLGKFILQ